MSARTRRSFLRASGVTIAGGATGLLVACGPASTYFPSAVSKLEAADLRVDVAALKRLLDLEHTAIAAYTAGAPLLVGSGLAAAAAKQFLGQEVAHASELSALIRRAGLKPALPAPSYDLGHPTRPADVLRLLARIERELVVGYLEAIPAVPAGPVRSTLASMLANEAQHLSIMRSARGQTPVPAAFVTGAE